MKVPALTARRLAAGAAAVVAALGITTAASAATSAHSHAAATTVPKCRESQLGVWLDVAQGNGAAGSIYYPLEFTNLSKTTCYMYGYPGVSAIDAAGHQLGAAAGRNAEVKAAVVNVAPGATVHSELSYTDVAVTPTCKPQAGYELKIFPPDQSFSTVASYDFSSCTTSKPVYLNVQVIQPGV